MASNQINVQPLRRKSNIASGKARGHNEGMAGLTNKQIVGLAAAVVLGGMVMAAALDQQQPALQPAVSAEPPALVASAALAAAFADNEIAAAAKYSGAVQIRGATKEITTSFGGAPLLMLEGGVNIGLRESELASAAALHKDDEIEVACGKVRAALGTVNALDCVILPGDWASPAP
jgi:tRNA_anti-like